MRSAICVLVSEGMGPIQIDLFGKSRCRYLDDLDLDELMFKSEAFHQRTPDSTICRELYLKVEHQVSMRIFEW